VDTSQVLALELFDHFLDISEPVKNATALADLVSGPR
jgi:hypothetical protein